MYKETIMLMLVVHSVQTLTLTGRYYDSTKISVLTSPVPSRPYCHPRSQEKVFPITVGIWADLHHREMIKTWRVTKEYVETSCYTYFMGGEYKEITNHYPIIAENLTDSYAYYMEKIRLWQRNPEHDDFSIKFRCSWWGEGKMQFNRFIIGRIKPITDLSGYLIYNSLIEDCPASKLKCKEHSSLIIKETEYPKDPCTVALRGLSSGTLTRPKMKSKLQFKNFILKVPNLKLIFYLQSSLE